MHLKFPAENRNKSRSFFGVWSKPIFKPPALGKRIPIFYIVVAAKQVKEVNGEIGEFFVQVIFLQIGSRMTILFQFQEVEVS